MVTILEMDKENFNKVIEESIKSVEEITDDAIIRVLLPLTGTIIDNYQEHLKAAAQYRPRNNESSRYEGICRYYKSYVKTV